MLVSWGSRRGAKKQKKPVWLTDWKSVGGYLWEILKKKNLKPHEKKTESCHFCSLRDKKNVEMQF